MKTISFELVKDYVRGWHEVDEQTPAMFEHTHEFTSDKEDENEQILETTEKLKHFNDNYLNYTLKDGKLFYDETHNGFEIERARRNTVAEIIRLKYQLADMDYKTSKHADGDYTDEQWQRIVSERKTLRTRIRELEKQNI